MDNKDNEIVWACECDNCIEFYREHWDQQCVHLSRTETMERLENIECNCSDGNENAMDST